MIKTHFLTLAAASMLMLALGGCAAQRSYTNAKPTAFLTSTGHAGRGKMERLPFQQSWLDKAVDAGQYKRIVIRPVTTGYLRADNWMESAGVSIKSAAEFQTAVGKLAGHFDSRIRAAFRDPKNRLAVAQDARQPGTLVLEVAVTEVVFGHPSTYAASLAVSGGGVAQSMLLAPTVAFEARVVDGATGKVVGTAADRRGTKMKIVDVNQFTYNKPNEEICSEWAQQLMQTLNPEAFPVVKRAWASAF